MLEILGGRVMNQWCIRCILYNKDGEFIKEITVIHEYNGDKGTKALIDFRAMMWESQEVKVGLKMMSRV